MITLPLVLAIILVAYLLGSIPFGLIISKLAGQGDIRKIGSGNIGATNVLRTGRKDLAVATVVLDGLKGVLAVWIASKFSTGVSGLMAAAGFFAILGHCFPVWLKFKGGKGVATAVGVTFALSLVVGCVMGLAWLATAVLFRISSAAALVALVVTALVSLFLFPLDAAFWVVAFCLMIVAKHHQKIRRLIAGTEPKIGDK